MQRVSSAHTHTHSSETLTKLKYFVIDLKKANAMERGGSIRHG